MPANAKMHQRRESLRKFSSLTGDLFQQVIRDFGYQDGACYRLTTNLAGVTTARMVVCSSLDSHSNGASVTWPAHWRLHSDYTTFRAANLPDRTTSPQGWTKAHPAHEPVKDFPKSAQFYFPVNDFSSTFLCFVMIDLPVGGVRRRHSEGELVGELEAIANRVSGWLKHEDDVRFVSESTFEGHLRNLTSNVERALDHELRTPLQSIAGYSQLLAMSDLSTEESRASAAEYQGIIAKEVRSALYALERLGTVFHTDTAKSSESLEQVDLKVLLSAISKRIVDEAPSIIGTEETSGFKCKLSVHTDSDVSVDGSGKLLSWALWEVVKNAAEFSRGGQISISLFVAGDMAVIDIQDDGVGIPAGAEELIFLRFYQEPSLQPARRGRRGMGLGLFLARQIAERHLGMLQVVRQGSKISAPGQNRGTVFRFSIPLSEESSRRLKIGA